MTIFVSGNHEIVSRSAIALAVIRLVARHPGDYKIVQCQGGNRGFFMHGLIRQGPLLLDSLLFGKLE